MNAESHIIEMLERQFWDALVAQDAQAAIDLLAEPALMVSSHGAMRFDHAQYRQMAETGTRANETLRRDVAWSWVMAVEPDGPLASPYVRAHGQTAIVGAAPQHLEVAQRVSRRRGCRAASGSLIGQLRVESSLSA